MSNLEKASVGPLGLFGFGMTTVLLNFHNIGLFPLNTMIMAMGLAFGGCSQIIAGKLEFKKGNTFGGVVFSSYGAFWWTLVLIWVLPKMNLGDAPEPISMAFYLLMWGLLTFIFFLQTLKGHLTGKLIFFSLTLLFVLLALGDFTGNKNITTAAGFVGIICGALAIYEGAAIMINEKYKRTILPL